MKLRQKKRNKRIAALPLMAVLILSLLLFSPPADTRADAVTDTLSVHIGYSGMELSEYVQLGKYSWYELMDALPLYEEAYSFYQSGNSADRYNAIVDAARGFYISDILNYSNVYAGDILNIMFYVEDASGIRSSFDYGSLFGTRYYFEDMAGHRKAEYAKKEVKVQTGTRDVTEIRQVPVMNEDGTQKIEEIPGELLYNEDGSPMIDKETGEQMRAPSSFEPVYEEKEVVVGSEPVYETKLVDDYTKVLGYSFEECWNYCRVVQPMLALEDNWASFTETFETIGPDWSYANAGNRFRLLFGQTLPTESLTSKSDKYVSAIYITLTGMASFGDMTEDGKYGSNTVEINVSGLYNQEMTDQLSKFLKLRSSDDSVIRINRIETVSDSVYSDVSRVVVYYDVVGDGHASFIGGFGSGGSETDLSSSGNIVVKNGKASFVAGPIQDNPDEEDDKEDPDKKDTDKKDTDKKDTDKKDTDKKDTDKKNQEQTDPVSADTKRQDSDSHNSVKPSVSESNDSDQELQRDLKKENSEVLSEEERSELAQDSAEELQTSRDQTFLYELSDDLVKKLSGRNLSAMADVPDTSITQLQMEDYSEEEEKEEKKLLLFTGLAGLGVLCLGGLTEYLSFKRRLKNNSLTGKFSGSKQE